MRIFVFILALLGGLACGGVGWIWKSDAASPEVKELMRLMDQIVADKDWEELVRGQGKDPEQARELVARFRQVIPLSYALLAAFPLAVGAGLLALNRRGPLAAPLFLLGVAAPFYFAWRLSAIDSGFLTRVAVITGPLILAGLLSFFVRPRRPRVEEGLEIEESEDALPERRPRPRPRKAASPAITAAPAPPPPPRPSEVRYPCPKCRAVLKVPMEQTHKAIRCPRCKTTSPVPARVLEQAITASPPPPPPPAEEPLVELLDDAPKPRPKKRAVKRKNSPVAVVLAILLLLGGSTVFSVLAALDVLQLNLDKRGKDLRATPHPRQNGRDDPGGGPGRDPFGGRRDDRQTDDQQPNQPDDPAPDPREEARLATARNRKLKEHQEREKPLIETLRSAPPSEDGDSSALLTLATANSAQQRVVFSPDGTTLAAPADNVIKLWDARTGKERLTLTGHTKQIKDIAFAPDGQLLASSSFDETVRLWDVKTGATRHVCPHKGQVEAVAFTLDGRFVLTGSVDESFLVGAIKAWDVSTGANKGTRGNPPGFVMRLACSPAGRYLAYACASKEKVVIYDLPAQQTQRVLDCGAEVRALAFSPDGHTLAVAAGDHKAGTLKLWEVRTGKVLRTFPGDTKGILTLAFRPDGKLLATGPTGDGWDGSFTLWDVTTGKERRTVRGARLGSVRSLAFSPGGTFLATASGGAVKVWAMDDLLDDRAARALDAVKTLGSVTRKGRGFHVELSREVKDEDLAKLKDLPRLVSLSLEFKEKITDAGLAHLAGLADLEELNLAWCKSVSDAGLAHLKGLKRLTVLNLANLDKVTDTGMAHLAGLTGLKGLYLTGTKVTHTGLAHLKRMTAMERLDLAGLEVTGAGLAHLKGMIALSELNLHFTRVTDAGLAHLKGMAKMRKLLLGGNEEVTDAGLAHLKGLTQMEELNLADLKVTDAALAHLKAMTGLKKLDLSSTGVTDAGFAHLAGLTNLTELEFGGLEDFKGSGLRHLKGIKGLKKLNLQGTAIADAGLVGVKDLTQLEVLALPQAVTDGGFVHLAGLTNLTKLEFGTLPGLKGPGLEHLKGIKGLKELYLQGTGVTDAGLAGVKDLTQLETLLLPPAITDAGFVHLAGLTNLKELFLGELKGLKGPGLQHLKGLSKLTTLYLNSTGLTDDGVQHLKGLSQLRTLKLPKQTGDAGVAHLAGMTGLTTLNLDETKVTDAGVAHLKGLTNLERLDLSKTKITDAALDHLVGLKKLRIVTASDTPVSKEAINKLQKALPDVDVWKF